MFYLKNVQNNVIFYFFFHNQRKNVKQEIFFNNIRILLKKHTSKMYITCLYTTFLTKCVSGSKTGTVSDKFLSTFKNYSQFFVYVYIHAYCKTNKSFVVRINNC